LPNNSPKNLPNNSPSHSPTYPVSVWDCLFPYNPGSEVSNISQPALNLPTAPTNLKVTITNVQLYVFKNAANFTSFTGAAAAANAFGATTANLAAAFASATQNGVAVDLTGNFSSTIVQELGHMLDQAWGTPSGKSAFSTALTSDITYLNAQANAWPVAYHTQHPTYTNWQIFQAIYPSALTDIFDYEFMEFDNQSTLNDLNTILANDMPNTKSYVANCFGANPTCVATVTSNNSINCNQHIGGAYPENGNFFACNTTTFATSGQTALTQYQAMMANATYGNVKTVLTAGAAKFYVFDNPVAAKTFTAAAGCCTAAQSQNFYNSELGNTAATVDGPPPVTQLWVQTTNPPYPGYVLQTSSQIKNTTSHETGHQYDALANGTVLANFPSQSTGMNSAATKDLAYMQANDPNYANGDYANNTHWLQKGLDGPTWSELFAEEFAIGEAGQILVVDPIIVNYWQCSTFFTQFWMKNGRAAVAADYTAANLARCN
jgi:hypothetical protein